MFIDKKFTENHYPCQVKIASYAKYAASILTVNFILSALILKAFRHYAGYQLFEQILLSCLIGALLLVLTIRLVVIVKPISADVRVFMIWMILLSSTLMLSVGPNTVMNIDRSRSFYVLSWVQNGDVKFENGQLSLSGVKSSEKLNPLSIRERVDEQISRRLIELRGQKYYLSKKGKLTLSVAKKIADFYLLEGWFKNQN